MDRKREATPDFLRQLAGYGLTTAEILYHLPDHPSLLQSYVWQDYDLAPAFPILSKFLKFWRDTLEGGLHSAGRTQPPRRRVPPALTPGLPGPAQSISSSVSDEVTEGTWSPPESVETCMRARLNTVSRLTRPCRRPPMTSAMTRPRSAGASSAVLPGVMADSTRVLCGACTGASPIGTRRANALATKTM